MFGERGAKPTSWSRHAIDDGVTLENGPFWHTFARCDTRMFPVTNNDGARCIIAFNRVTMRKCGSCVRRSWQECRRPVLPAQRKDALRSVGLLHRNPPQAIFWSEIPQLAGQSTVEPGFRVTQ